MMSVHWGQSRRYFSHKELTNGPMDFQLVIILIRPIMKVLLLLVAMVSTLFLLVVRLVLKEIMNMDMVEKVMVVVICFIVKKLEMNGHLLSI